MTFKNLGKLANWLETTKQTLNKYFVETGKKPKPVYKEYLIKRKVGYIVDKEYYEQYNAWKMNNRRKQGRKKKIKE